MTDKERVNRMRDLEKLRKQTRKNHKKWIKMKKMKCKLCGKYEIKEKEIGMKKLEISEDVEIPVFHFWKWCKLNNNWCRNVAGGCGVVIQEPEKKLEGETNEII